MKPSDRGPYLRKLRRHLKTVQAVVFRLHSNREIYRRLVEIFSTNPRLQNWTPLHTFILTGYVYQACLAVRRLLDTNADEPVSLGTIVESLQKHPKLISRDEWVAEYCANSRQVRLPARTDAQQAALARETIAVDCQAEAHGEFDRFAGPGEEYLDPDIVAGWLSAAKAKCQRVRKCVDKRMAHLDQNPPQVPKWGDLDKAIEAVSQLFKDVSLLLSCAFPDDLLPTWQGEDWELLLYEPWLARRSGRPE